MRIIYSISFLVAFALIIDQTTEAAFDQGDENAYLANFDLIDAASYAAIDDPSGASSLPSDLLAQCKKENNGVRVDSEINVDASPTDGSNIILSSNLSSQCQSNSICTIPPGVTLRMDSSLNVGALVVRGSLEWNDITQQQYSSIYLCAGFVAVEEGGAFRMDLQDQGNRGWIYIKDDGAVHPVLRSRSFGGVGSNSIVEITGSRQLLRTWSLLSEPLRIGDRYMKLLHNPVYMGWKVGDRIAIAPTKSKSRGTGQEFRIVHVSDDNDGTITLSQAAQHDFDADFYPPPDPVNAGHPKEAALKSAEVVNLERNIVITGDDFTHVSCDASLPEAVPGEETSTIGCRCSTFRTKCTMGLHTAQMNAGLMRIQNTRVEKCGQRGVEGKYCLHFHKLQDCPDCLFKNNAVENSHQRGIIVHSTHLATVEGNTLYNIRGAGVYIEDGNEMHNNIKYNVVICPFPFNDETLHGCTVPGTSNRIADTSDNQSSFFTRAATNNMIGNRGVNSFNGMFLKAGSIGRGSSYDKVCESASRIGRFEGNVFHGNGRFGTYTLGSNYPKDTDQAVDTNGHNIDKSLCEGFDSQGNTRGVSAAFKDHLDYGCAFVGHYNAGDVQHNGHKSFDNNNLIYWKETKNFENGCSAHITNGHYINGNMALPDMGTFVIEDTTFGDGVSLEPNHHCNVGTTGVLCMPQYVLHNVRWTNSQNNRKFVKFQYHNPEITFHEANQNHGGIFTLSPPDAAVVMQGGYLEAPFFPPGYVSLVSSRFNYLLSAPNNVCILGKTLREEYGMQYDNGILCKVPLRALKLYTRDLVSTTAPSMRVEVWFNNLGNEGQTGPVDAYQDIGFHQIGEDYRSPKQGYSLPVIPGTEQSYRLSLNNGDGNIPVDWVVEFSDLVIGNRWNIEYIYLSIQGRNCGPDGLVNSHHDRKFLWSGDSYITQDAWGKQGACLGEAGNPPTDMPLTQCDNEVNSLNNAVISATECPDFCADAGQTCSDNNSYCDCGSRTCHCKPGYSGTDCSIDLCAAARCGDHGTCAARYLGTFSDLPVTSDKACICDVEWSGSLCELNPCLESGKTCSEHGTCIASGGDAVCKCDTGYSGENCEISCDGFCPGSYPYGCATSVSNIVKYGCTQDGACSYLQEGESYPWDGFCTYKEIDATSSCKCTSSNDCEIIGKCRPDGTCPDPIAKQDETPCNSKPWGTCKAGICLENAKPNPAPTPVIITPAPFFQPSTPTKNPIILETFKCGCKDCTSDVLSTLVGTPAHSCGDRIDWLQTIEGGSLNEEEACIVIGRDEYPSICGPMCDPTRCNNSITPAPTRSSSYAPTQVITPAPTLTPSYAPTPDPTASPSIKPSSGVSHPCGCEDCTSDVLSTLVGTPAHSCGARIDWLQTIEGGSLNEEEACIVIGRDEYPSICGPMCDPTRCNNSITPAPTHAPSYAPTPAPIRAPSIKPSSGVSHPCGCEECTSDVLSTLVGTPAHSCGARIDWLQTIEGGSLKNLEACTVIGRDDFPSIEDCGKCDPTSCSSNQNENRCGGAVNAGNFNCGPDLWSPTSDLSIHCYAYGGDSDPCALHNNNDIDDGIYKDPSNCVGEHYDTFYLWDEPDTQGKTYDWAGEQWLAYSKRFKAEIMSMRQRGVKFTSPMITGGGPGEIKQRISSFYSSCGPDCNIPSSAAFIDVIAINAFCGPWNINDPSNPSQGCRNGASYILGEVESLPTGEGGGLPVYITNWSRLQVSATEDQLAAMDATDEFFKEGSPVERVYWFGATDYGGNSSNNLLTDKIESGIHAGTTLGQLWKQKCDSMKI
eukprot:CAMPEP_0195538828 /NCGR_PEP_ID=MMETSP0794_2-20130614/49734_1 /TAXON_ID=515487 /ORGANISM="Stephanopyxis turris, Strain CCMP 815" /LENGTH=1792 /DNA_ID=CAMNT_0040672837 /DNA_START=109 /DNA_END=5487 /DNA_ORIENTATION=-